MVLYKLQELRFHRPNDSTNYSMTIINDIKMNSNHAMSQNPRCPRRHTEGFLEAFTCVKTQDTEANVSTSKSQQ